MIDLDALECAALAATPGPWHVVEEGIDGWIMSANGTPTSFGGEAHEGYTSATDPDVAFVCAANPAAVLELVRELRAARQAKALTLIGEVIEIGDMDEGRGVRIKDGSGDFVLLTGLTEDQARPLGAYYARTVSITVSSAEPGRADA